MIIGLKVLELFAGTRSIGRAFERRGHAVFSVEWNKDFENISLYKDISELTAQEIIDSFGRPDVIWASPDCTTSALQRYPITDGRTRKPEISTLSAIMQSSAIKMTDHSGDQCLVPAQIMMLINAFIAVAASPLNGIVLNTSTSSAFDPLITSSLIPS